MLVQAGQGVLAGAVAAAFDEALEGALHGVAQEGLFVLHLLDDFVLALVVFQHLIEPQQHTSQTAHSSQCSAQLDETIKGNDHRFSFHFHWMGLPILLFHGRIVEKNCPILHLF